MLGLRRSLGAFSRQRPLPGLDSQLGSLERGKLADLVILKANPLDDIRNAREVELVVQNGIVYSGEDASRVYPNPRPAPRMYYLREP